MANSIQSANINKAGTCPHGVVPGACPICSNMGGGGGLRVGERPQKPGEMSYHECAMIGAMMRAREAQQKLHEENLRLHAEAMKNFERSMQNLAQKIAGFTSMIQNFLPLKPLAFIINTFILPVVKAFADLSNVLSGMNEKFVQIKEKFIDIMDKLNAIFGEAKAFIEKKISELVSVIKSKLKNIFKIFKRNNTEDEKQKIDEDKKIFRLKTFIQKLFMKQNNQKQKLGNYNDSEN